LIMRKLAGYAALILALLLFGMLAPTIGHMASSEGAPGYMALLSLLIGAAFIGARAGYEAR
jgi:hypothetical protein